MESARAHKTASSHVILQKAPSVSLTARGNDSPGTGGQCESIDGDLEARDLPL